MDCRGLSHRELNDRLAEPFDRIKLVNVLGQRYIGTRLKGRPCIEIFGVPGNNLGAFFRGRRIVVYGNAQDGVGNTMYDGEIVIHGNAGDVLGLSMQGGTILVKGDVGYRAGVHMKGRRSPAIVIGGSAEDFLGEYMAGGLIIVLNLKGERLDMSTIGIGMHGGKIFIRGRSKGSLNEYVDIRRPDAEDERLLEFYIERFSEEFGVPKEEIWDSGFVKLEPVERRPYRSFYALRAP